LVLFRWTVGILVAAIAVRPVPSVPDIPGFEMSIILLELVRQLNEIDSTEDRLAAALAKLPRHQQCKFIYAANDGDTLAKGDCMRAAVHADEEAYDRLLSARMRNQQMPYLLCSIEMRTTPKWLSLTLLCFERWRRR
jgi:hypothetical protein